MKKFFFPEFFHAVKLRLKLIKGMFWFVLEKKCLKLRAFDVMREKVFRFLKNR